MNKKFLGGILALCFALGGTYHFIKAPSNAASAKTETVNTVYGSINVSEPVLLDILSSKPMQRLKKVNQYGVMAFIKPEQKYTRYTHSLGVFYLIRKFGGTLEEQVAGLIHDISHTAFSHIADFIHDTHQNKYSYQDTIFKWYLEKTELLAILKKHNLERVAEFGTTVEYKMLKDDLPHLCADRIEYNIYGGYVEGWITQEEMRDMISKIAYRNKEWVFTDCDAAEKFARISIDLSVQNWTSAQNGFISKTMANLLKKGFEKNIITKDDFHFGTDQEIWNTLQTSNDTDIKTLFNKIKNHESSYKLGSSENYNYHYKGKYRGLDPFVLHKGNVLPLSKVRPKFAHYLNLQKQRCKEHYIIYT